MINRKGSNIQIKTLFKDRNTDTARIDPKNEGFDMSFLFDDDKGGNLLE